MNHSVLVFKIQIWEFFIIIISKYHKDHFEYKNQPIKNTVSALYQFGFKIKCLKNKIR